MQAIAKVTAQRQRNMYKFSYGLFVLSFNTFFLLICFDGIHFASRTLFSRFSSLSQLVFSSSADCASMLKQLQIGYNDMCEKNVYKYKLELKMIRK